MIRLLFVLGLLGHCVRAISNQTTSYAQVDEARLQDFKIMSQYAAAGYCNKDKPSGERVRCGFGVCRDVENNGATIIGSFKGLLTGSGGFVGVDNTRQQIVVSFRGNNNLRSFFQDIILIKAPCGFGGDGCRIHTGLLASWDEISSKVFSTLQTALSQYPNYQIAVTGHSSGGTVATLAVAHFKNMGLAPDLYTYGANPGGNTAFAEFASRQLGQVFRITHLDDIGPKIPPTILGFAHPSPEYWIYKGSQIATSYAPSDIKICEGYTSLECNGGTLLPNPIPHFFYFGLIYGCAGIFFQP